MVSASSAAGEVLAFLQTTSTPTLCCLSFVTILAVAWAQYTLWKSWEESRARKHVRVPGGRLPSPVAVLPKWLGFIGGHTLLVNPTAVGARMESWSKECGGDYEVQMFGKRVVVLTGLADIRRILTIRPSKMMRGLDSKKLTWAAGEAGMIPSMFFDEGKEWGRSRRLIAPNLNGHNIAVMLPLISKIAERLCAKLAAQADAGEVVDAKESFGRFTHDVIALTAFGLDVDSTSAAPGRPCPSYEAIASATYTIMVLAMKPLAILGWTTLSTRLPWVRRSKEHSLHLKQAVQRAVDAVREEARQAADRAASGGDGADAVVPAPGETMTGGTLLRKIVGATHDKGNSNRMVFSDEEVLYQAKSLFLAGTDTTALTLSWTMYYLVKYPDVFARCRAEALQAAPASNGMVSTSEQLSQLVFCSAVFREVLRLRSVAPYLLFHGKDDYKVQDGSVYPVGTSFSVLIRMASVSEEAFTRAADFVPERWIEAEREEALLGKGAEKREGDVRHVEEAYLAFGAGPRVCPGQDMAKAEAAIIIAAICARFDMALAPGQDDPPEEFQTFTTGPASVDLTFTRRER